MQDATKVLLGSHGSSDFEASCENADPATYEAGLAVRRTSGGGLTVASGSGSLIGVSVGADLADTKKTSVCRAGNRIPVLLSGYAYLVKEDLTFFTKVNEPVAIEFLDTESSTEETVTVTGDAEAGWLISVGMEDGVSTATLIKAALDADADAAALIDVLISGTASDAQAAFAEDDIDGAVPLIGKAVHFSNTTGKAVNTGGTTSGATYISGVLTGVKMDGSTAPAALIDMGGGL